MARPAAASRATPTTIRSKVRVGIVFDIGGKDDRSFNAAAWRGVRCAETGKWPDGTDCGKPALGIVLRDVEPGTPVNIEPAMRSFAERNYDLIIGIGFAQAPIIETVAKDYPNIHFAIVDGVSQLPNVASLVFKEHEGSYLVGILAAKTSKTGTLGISRRHGHRADSPLREGLRRGREVGEPEHPRHSELRRRHRRRLEQSRERARSWRWRRFPRAPTSSSRPPAIRAWARSMPSKRWARTRTAAPRTS